MYPVFDAFYSDPHFGHWTSEDRNIIVYAGRPFDTIEEMDEALIANFNEVVSKDSRVLCLGDMFLCSYEKAEKIMQRLNGHKALVPGNHDRSLSRMSSLGFEIVAEGMVLNIAGKLVRVSHYPYWDPNASYFRRLTASHKRRLEASRPPKIKGEILMHGHTHSSRKVYENRIHVGVDAWEYRPVTWDRIEAEVRKL